MPQDRSPQGQQAGGGPSRDHAHLWETLGPGSPAQGRCLSSSHSVIQQTSLGALKAEPHPGSVPTSALPQHLWGEKKLKAAVSG